MSIDEAIVTVEGRNMVYVMKVRRHRSHCGVEVVKGVSQHRSNHLNNLLILLKSMLLRCTTWYLSNCQER